MLRAIIGITTPLFLFIATIWFFATLFDGENPFEVIKELFCGYQVPEGFQNTMDEYAKELIAEGFVTRSPVVRCSLDQDLSDIRYRKDLAKIDYYVLSGKEKIIEKCIDERQSY